MEPFFKARSGADGRFSIAARGSFYTVMAMDAQRARGGLAIIPKDDNGCEIEIRLRPLVRVQGTIEGPEPGHRPSTAMVVTEVPEDPTRPLHMSRLVLGESREGHFTMSLPPGRYVLDAYDGQFKGRLAKEITLTGDTAEVDLGVLTLRTARPNINDKIKESQASGGMGDYKKRYGEKLPDWHIVDARGEQERSAFGLQRQVGPAGLLGFELQRVLEARFAQTGEVLRGPQEPERSVRDSGDLR